MWAEKVSRGKFIAYKHIRYLEKKFLQLLADKDQKGLIVEASVRHGKSEYFSRVLPAWYLSYFPDKIWQLTGYGQDFADDFSRKVREYYIKSGHRISQTHRKISSWGVYNREGMMRSVGTGGRLTGYGCNILSCDDSTKSVEDANSLVKRQKLWEWWWGDAYGSRLRPDDGSCILVQARRHEDDLVGRQIAVANESGAHWERVTFPALARDDIQCPLGRKTGEPLWPEMYPREWLEKQRNDFIAAGMLHEWEGLWQQNPMTNPKYRDFESTWFTPDKFYYDEIPTGLRPVTRFLSIDPSRGSKRKSGDYSAFLDCDLRNPASLWVIPFLKQMRSDAVELQAIAMMQSNSYDAVIIDGMHGQDNMVRHIASKAYQLGITTPVYTYSTHTDKETRIRVTLSTPLSLGKVHWLDYKLCPSSAIARQQFIQFPTSHDDAPDALEMAYMYLEWRRLGASAMLNRGIELTLMTPA